MKFYPCKITVIQKEFYPELVNAFVKNPDYMKKCDWIQENQEFIVTNPYIMPEKMCASAWADIRTYIIAIASGGSFDFMIQPNTAIALCSDPFRPVSFKIERIPTT